MSLSLINAAKNVRVALCGPDKSELVLEGATRIYLFLRDLTFLLYSKCYVLQVVPPFVLHNADCTLFTAILKTKSTVQNPACGLKFADWFVDKAAASKLPDSVQVLSY